MHHPDIYNILLIIEDYFLLIDNHDPTYQLKSIVGSGDDGKHGIGIRISLKLFNGCMEIEIASFEQDNNSVRFTYRPDCDPSNFVNNFLVSDNEYCEQAIRLTVKKILLIDKESGVAQSTQN